MRRWVGEDEKSAQEELSGTCFESENNAEYDERRGYLAVPIGRYRASYILIVFGHSLCFDLPFSQ